MRNIVLTPVDKTTTSPLPQHQSFQILRPNMYTTAHKAVALHAMLSGSLGQGTRCTTAVPSLASDAGGV